MCPQERTVLIRIDDWKEQAFLIYAESREYSALLNKWNETCTRLFGAFIRLDDVNIMVSKTNTFLGIFNVFLSVLLILVSVTSIALSQFKIIFVRKLKVIQVVQDVTDSIGNTETVTPRFDVFLSYSTVDREWVETVLLKFLECRNYKVCFGERDFKIGKSLVGSIASAIMKSRKTISVLSPDFWQVAGALNMN